MIEPFNQKEHIFGICHGPLSWSPFVSLQVVAALPFGNSLRLLDVSHNNFGDDGAQVFADALEDVESPFTFLSDLRVAHCQLTGRGLLALLTAIARRSQAALRTFSNSQWAGVAAAVAAERTALVYRADQAEQRAQDAWARQAREAAALAQRYQVISTFFSPSFFVIVCVSSFCFVLCICPLLVPAHGFSFLLVVPVSPTQR
jgi:hypothetical protein